MIRFKQLFADKKTKIDLPPGEYEGPLNIEHSCIIDGHGATLWQKKGPALTINTSQVTIKNLRIELIESPADDTAVIVNGNDISFSNVEVFGRVQGISDDSTDWDLPRIINLGSFAADIKNEYFPVIKVGSSCHIVSEVDGITINPCKFSRGKVKLRLIVEPLRDTTILYGSLLLKTDFGIIRRIYVTGRADKNVSQISQGNADIAPPKEKLNSTKKKDKLKNGITEVIKGQRILVPNVEKFNVIFNAEKLPIGMDIDAYAFCLNSNKQVRGDDDLVYFSNPRHESRAVQLLAIDDKPGVMISLLNLPTEIMGVAVCFAIYDEENRSNNSFNKVRSPSIIVYGDDKALFQFPLHLDREKIVTALEFYRHKGKWKINFIGAGYSSGLRKLCESYGLDVL